MHIKGHLIRKRTIKCEYIKVLSDLIRKIIRIE